MQKGVSWRKAQRWRLLAPLTILPFDAAAVWAYGDLCANLERRGTLH